MVWTGRPLYLRALFSKPDTLTMADVEDDVVDDAGSGAAGGAAGNGKRFEVKKWNAVSRPAMCAVRCRGARQYAQARER